MHKDHFIWAHMCGHFIIIPLHLFVLPMQTSTSVRGKGKGTFASRCVPIAQGASAAAVSRATNLQTARIVEVCVYFCFVTLLYHSSRNFRVK